MIPEQDRLAPRMLLENVMDMVWVTDPEGTIIYINDRACRKVTGRSAQECIGVPNTEYFSEESIQNTAAWIIEALSEKPPRLEYRGEVEICHRNGHKIPCEVHVSILMDDKGEVIGYEGITRDISRRKRLEAELRQHKKNLEQLVEQRTRELKIQMDQLQKALEEIKILRGFLPICANCKKIRDDEGYWHQVESYISAHTDTKFTHSICPECRKKVYPDY